MLESYFNKVAILQDSCSYLLHAHLGFFLGKTFKKINQLSINYFLLKNNQCYVHRGIFRTKSNIYDGAFWQK